MPTKRKHERETETIDREFFEEFIMNKRDWRKQQYSFMQPNDMYCVYDLVMYVTDKNNPFTSKKYLIEIKSRNINFSDYQTATIDNDKLIALKNEAVRQGDVDGIYVVFLFPFDNKIALFNVDDVDLNNTVERYANKCTEDSVIKVKKVMNDMPLSIARLYDYDLSDFFSRRDALKRRNNNKNN